MQDRTRHRTAHRIAQTSRNLYSWAASRRRTAILLALRGACYGAGTGTMGLLTYWIEHHI
nr:hypothetical protein OH826_19195 [Streptomyces sp. NBC_00899]